MIRARVSFRALTAVVGKPSNGSEYAVGDQYFVLANTDQRVAIIETFNGLGERLTWELAPPGPTLASVLDMAREAVLAAGVEQRDQDERVHRFEVCA